MFKYYLSVRVFSVEVAHSKLKMQKLKKNNLFTIDYRLKLEKVTYSASLPLKSATLRTARQRRAEASGRHSLGSRPASPPANTMLFSALPAPKPRSLCAKVHFLSLKMSPTTVQKTANIKR